MGANFPAVEYSAELPEPTLMDPAVDADGRPLTVKAGHIYRTVDSLQTKAPASTPRTVNPLMEAIPAPPRG